MERISSLFFMLALIIYYIPKVLRLKKSKYIKGHILLGGISILTMMLALISKIGQADFVKYIGFATIMTLIGLTGYLFKRNPKVYRALHIISTVSFFIYLYISIKVI